MPNERVGVKVMFKSILASRRIVRLVQLSAILGMSLTAACTTMDAQSTSITLAGPAEAPRGLQALCESRPEICQSDQHHMVKGPALDSATGGNIHPWFRPGVLTETIELETGARLISVNLPKLTDLTVPMMNLAVLTEPAVFTPPAPVTPNPVSSAPNPVPAAPVALAKSASAIEATPELFALLERVNRDINERLHWVADSERYGVDELWLMPLTFGLGTEGDCEDFALEKRHALIEAGLPRDALALAMGYSPAAGYHAVLMVRTTDGDFVLDNTTPWIDGWENTGYRWIAVQASADLLDWRLVSNKRSLAS